MASAYRWLYPFLICMGLTAQESQPKLVRIPPNWRNHPHFDQRFEALASQHVIDLSAIRFATDDLVDYGSDSGREFLLPDVSGFASDLIREPFELGSRDLFIIQAEDPTGQAKLRQVLVQLGIAIRDYIPHQAYLVELNREQHQTLSNVNDVYWMGLFQPAWRIHPKLDYLVNVEGELKLAYTVLLDRQRTSFDQIFELAKKYELDVFNLGDRGRDWKVMLAGPTASIPRLAQVREVLWIEQFAPFRLHNNVARTSSNMATGRGAASGPIMDVEDVWTRGIRGEGQIASASDTGLSTGNFNTLHRDYGRPAEPNNPQRVIAAYALGRATWDDPNPNGGHGTHTSGSIVGNGIESGSTPNTNTFPGTSFAGTAPKAQFVFQSIMDSSGFLSGIPANLNNLFQQPYNDGARVHSNSWGSDLNGSYNPDSQDVDEFTWNNPDMVITFSAGNSGQDGQEFNGSCLSVPYPIDGVIDTDSIGTPGTAKNCVTVGATENYRPNFVYEFPQGDCTGAGGFTQQAWGWFNGCNFSINPLNTDLLADNANGMGAFSSRGPTDDNRFKPDVSAPGIAIISTRTNQSQGYEQWGICPVPVAQRPHYLSQGGTSMANPLTAGTATLVRQYYVDGWHANNTAITNGVAVGGDSFNPSAAMVKATLINGAWDMAPGQYGGGATQEIPPGWDAPNNIPNNAMGFGRVDLEGSLFQSSGFGNDPAREMYVSDTTTGLSTGQMDAHDVTVGSNADPLIVTLVWTDPYASTGAGTKLVNNLDLVVLSPSATRYYPNRVNFSGGSVDNTNNVEQVYVTAPEAGTWSIDVVGTSIPGNGVGGTTTQPYAVVISGIFVSPCSNPAAPSGLTATVNGLNSIFIVWNNVASDSYNLYRATTPGGPYSLIASGLVVSEYTDTSVSDGVEYFYVATAVNNPNCESGNSNEDSAIAIGDCIQDPTFGGLQTVDPFTTGGSCGLRLTWNAATSNCGTPVVYNLYRATSSGGPYTLIASCVTDLFYDDTAVVGGTTYYYRARAEDATTGHGGPCNSGNEDTNTNTVSGLFPTSSVVTVFEDDFDGTQFPGDIWQFDDGPSPGGSCPGTYAVQWYRPETGFCSGNALASNNGAANPAYADTMNGRAIIGLAPTGPGTGGIVLPSGFSSITLTFDHDYDFEGANWDGGRIRISMDGSNFTTITPVGGYPGNTNASTSFCHPWPNQPAYIGDSGGCVSATFDLTAYAGDRVWIAFNMGTDDFSSGDDGWVVDNVLIQASISISCNTAPEPLQFFTATSTDGQNVLEWMNPGSGGYGSTMVRFSTSSFPASPIDGTLLVNQNDGLGNKGTFTHSGLTNTTTYYYSAWVDDGSTNYSGAKTVSGRPFDNSGVEKWAYSTGATAMAPPGIGSIYSVANDRVFHSMETGIVGSGQWPAPWTPMAMNGPAQARPPIAPGVIGGNKVALLGSQDGYAYAVNADTGAQIWASAIQLGDIIQSAPSAIFGAYGGTVDQVFVGSRNLTAANNFYGLNTATGTVAWTFNNSGGSGDIGIISGTPVVDYASNRVYFTSRSRSGGSASTVWCLNVFAGSATLAWEAAVGDIDSSPILHNGRIYVGTLWGEVVALDANTGAPTWGAAYNANDGPIKVSVSTDVGNPNLVFSTTNRVHSIADNGASASLNWSVTSVPGPSSPLVHIGGSQIYVGGSNGVLYQLDKGSGSVTGSRTIGSGSAAVGSPAFANVGDVLFVGTEAGTIHSVTTPLP